MINLSYHWYCTQNFRRYFDHIYRSLEYALTIIILRVTPPISSTVLQLKADVA